MRHIPVRFEKNGKLLFNHMLECRKRSCDKCILRFKCFTTEIFIQGTVSKESQVVPIGIRWAVKNLAFRNDGIVLTWATSRRAKKGRPSFGAIYGGCLV